MEIILTVGYASFFIFLISRFKFYHIDGIKSSTIKAAYLIKLMAGISLGLLYTYYYTDRLTADTFKYFDDGYVLFSVLYKDPASFFKMLTGVGKTTSEMQVCYDRMTNWYDTFSPFNDNRSMIRLNALLMPFTMGKYYVHVAFISFLSFTGIVGLVKTFNRYHPNLVKEIFIIFLLLPSILFWCSGLLKDSLAIFILGILIYNIDKATSSTKLVSNKIPLLILLCLLLMVTKFQVFFLLIPVFISWILFPKYKKHPFKILLPVSAFFFGFVTIFDLTINDLGIINLLHGKQSAFFKLAVESDAGSLIKIPKFDASLKGLIAVIPSGFITGFTRPFITDTRNMLMFISGIENTLILSLGVYAIIKGSFRNIINSPIAVMSLYFSVGFFTLIGIMTPVLGALVRYKALALPFLVIFFIIIANEKKTFLRRMFSKLKL